MSRFLKTWPLWLLAMLLLAVCALVVFDVAIITLGYDSVSRRTLNWLWANPGFGYVAVAGASALVAWIAGVATGHLVWPQRVP